jgi:hypothetical protein
MGVLQQSGNLLKSERVTHSPERRFKGGTGYQAQPLQMMIM